ncbi:MAG: hypothetical protein ABI835_04015 [Chloroflexota bacterium]
MAVFHMKQAGTPRSRRENRAPKTTARQPVAPQPRQHGLLVIWLIGIALFGVYSAWQWATLMPELEQTYPTLLVYIVLGVLLLGIFAALGVLMRKRWSVYLLVAALAVGFVLQAVMGILSEAALFTLGFSLVILWGFVRPNWVYYT